MKKIYKQPQIDIYYICSKGSIAILNTSNNADVDYGGAGGDEDAYVKAERDYDIWGEDNN